MVILTIIDQLISQKTARMNKHYCLQILIFYRFCHHIAALSPTEKVHFAQAFCLPSGGEIYQNQYFGII